jgi:nucleoside 2-deoxyribosyltransferase
VKRFYLASAFDLRERVQQIAAYLERHGHVVPVQWWDPSGDAHVSKTASGSDDEFYRRASVQATAARDFGGVATCDVFVLVAHDVEIRKFNGAAVELGYALALQKPAYAIGRLDRSAMFAHVRRARSIRDVLRSEGLL